MPGTVQKCWGGPEHAAVGVLMEDGRMELFWLRNLDVAVRSEGPVSSERNDTDGREAHGLPFGYWLERDADLLVLRRPDWSFVAAFGAMAADPFEVEATVWEDAN